MTADYEVIEITNDTLDAVPRCGIKNRNHPGFLRKTAWLESNLENGMRARVMLTPKGVQCGYIEYIPGKYAWRGVEADGYMVIHCVWTFFREYQRRDLGASLIQGCIDDARREKMPGVAVVTRESPWLAGSTIFRKMGFDLVDTAPPDYELLVYGLRKSAATPRFKGNWEKRLQKYGDGLTIVRADQCPHTIKRTDEISAIALKTFGLKPHVVDLKTCRDAQRAPTPYAVFAIIYDGCLVADYQISARKFTTLMKPFLNQ
ncbi:MAG: hypothetical protein JSW71_09255 [Gemmatimonadota bacterium]|nr:MAG: hypothetical protein JSW71_09255 [Gemmatimonadota bacterium]